MRPAFLLAGLFFTASIFIESDTRADDVSSPFGIKARVPWTTSCVVGTPDPPLPYTVKRAFPQLTFKNPVYIAQEPGTDRIFVAELAGQIYAFSKSNPNPDAMELFLDIGRDLYSFSFHPQYEKNGFLFVFSPRDPKDKSEDKKSRVSRFQTGLDYPRRCSNDSEKIILEWRAGGHNGGEAIIGPDGFLYISTGDGTSGSDPNETGQGVDDLFSVILRIDVDHPAAGKAYSIPKDNPFIHYPDARPEVWAHGFRNPWRMSFDSKTGGLWVGDVGQDLWEMIWLVQRGGNYGWSVQEGSHPFHVNKKQGPGPILPPVIEHHHTDCRSITGGYVYYGKKLPELNGVYFYGDYEYGKIWGVRYDGRKVTWSKELADTALRIPSFGVSRDGEIYLMDHPSGELYELVPAPAKSANAEFSRKLSETGLFVSVKDHRVAAGVIPYSVNAPQWIDGAHKQRFVAVPGTSKITFVEKSGNAKSWGFEDGSVTIETLSLDMEIGNPASRRRIETRMMVKQQNHWLGYTYLWNDAGTDATLVDAAGTKLTFTINDPFAPNGKRQQTWSVPSRNECMVCHSRAAAFVLGLRTVQMNKDHDYDGIVDNQLRALNHIDLFTKPLSKNPDEYNSLPNPYEKTADLDARARAYLHVNCSVCHVSDGGGNARISLRHYEKIEETKLINEPPMHGSFGLPDARIIVPGDPFASVLFYRLSKLGRGRMPHVASSLTDQKGLDLIHDWIVHLDHSQAKQVESKSPVRAKNSAAVKTLLTQEVSADERNKAIDQLFSSTRGAFRLARLVANEPLFQPAREEVIARGVTQSDVNIRDLFERFVPESQRTKRLGETIDPGVILALTGNAEHGRRFFFSDTASQCKSCHRIKDLGGTIGPDLSQIGKKYKSHELLESLIEPAKKIEEKYVTYVLVTNAGKVLTGILVEKSEKQIVLNVFKEGKGELVRIPAADVDELLPQKKSLMPDRMLRDLTPQQAADLLEFLSSLK
jgi:uncharacterized repeat protein (TIGR03806 family)